MSPVPNVLRTFELTHPRVAFVLPPTGAFRREDRGQSSLRFEQVPSLRAPMEEAEAAGAVRAAGGTALILDAPAARWSSDRIRDELRRFAPDLVVVSATFGSLDEDLAWVRDMASEFETTKFAVRGAPCATGAAAILQRAPQVDFCVRGDYEPAFEVIVREGPERAPGVVLRGPDGVVERPVHRVDDLDTLPWPDRNSFDPSYYRVRGIGAVQATVRVQRGCPHACSYCLVPVVSGAHARHRSPRSIADEMAAVRATGIRWFYLSADTFSLERSWAFAVCAAIARAVPDARWVTTTRVECVDEDLIAAMATAGCYGISFGIDVASRVSGERVGKPARPGLAWEAMRMCDHHDVLSLGYFMIGFAWETEETLAETAAAIRSTRPDLLTVQYAQPYPGTRYHDELVSLGVAFSARDAQAAPALADHGVPAARLRRVAEAMLTRHYADPRVLASTARKMAPLLADRARERFTRQLSAAAGEPTPSSVRPR